MKFYYGFFEKNWADEFYWLEDFICNSKHLQRLEEVKNKFGNKTVDYYFGTNEGWEDIQFNDLLNCITLNEISESTYDDLARFFPTGLPYFVEECVDFIEERNEEDYE